MQKILILLIGIYRYMISPLLGSHCRFSPNCSHYAQIAIARYGSLTGSWIAVRRLSRCHPWQPGGFDPVPERRPKC